MDKNTLQDLTLALEASPNNLQLRITIIKGYEQLDELEKALEFASSLTPESLDDTQHQYIVALLFYKLNQLEKAEAFCRGDSPELLLLRARILLAKGDGENGLKAYQKAIASNSTLEDVNLEKELKATQSSQGKVSSITNAQKDRPKLRVISNDDTDSSEVVRLLAPAEKAINFGDVGGLDEVKKQIHKKIILPFQKPSIFQRFKKQVGGGILLYGPPGCGKTLLARATAGECHAQFFNVEISDIMDMYIGESERKLHAIFEKARADSPSVLFFDEVEALGGKRQYTREATSSKLVSQFLSELDGFSQANSGVLVLASTNVPWALDSAFLRPGRFDRLIFIPPPDKPARLNILDILLKDRPTAELNLEPVAAKTSGFSGADLKNLVETAVDEAIEESLTTGEETHITQEHLQEALKVVKSTTLEWLTTARNYAKYANESGQYNDVLAFLKKYGKS